MCQILSGMNLTPKPSWYTPAALGDMPLDNLYLENVRSCPVASPHLTSLKRVVFKTSAS